MKYLVLVMLFASSAIADVLMIDRLNNNHGIDLPSKGTTMSQVQSQFGKASSVKAAVGKPPITTWKYDKFSVYFEHNHVIHAVVHKATANEKGPKPLE